MRHLTISLLILCLLSCQSYPKKQQLKVIESPTNTFFNTYFSNTKTDYIYKAHITAYGNTFGGLLIVKKIESNQHRIAFTTEMGNKIFDFTINNNDFKVNYVLDDLNRKLLLNILKQDFTTLVKERITTSNVFSKETCIIFETKILEKPHYYFTKNENLEQIIRVKNGKPNTVFTFSKINDNIANQINITHNNITLEINLKSIY